MGDKRVAIVQSNYVPWRGYFDLIASVDEFVLLDDAQYTRRDWRNRNRIKTAQGTRWLTIPVEVSGKYTQPIYETEIADEKWSESHWQTLRQAYLQAPCFEEVHDFVAALYEDAPGPLLTDVNLHFLTRIGAELGIETPLTLSMAYAPEGTKSERLLDICVKAGATEYVSGPAARAYLDEDLFSEAGIALEWFEYGDYEEYPQVHPPFDPRVSILDVIFCAGADAAQLTRASRQEAGTRG
jgi:WbqC-like protein family